jgi:hypothetical protein
MSSDHANAEETALGDLAFARPNKALQLTVKGRVGSIAVESGAEQSRFGRPRRRPLTAAERRSVRQPNRVLQSRLLLQRQCLLPTLLPSIQLAPDQAPFWEIASARLPAAPRPGPAIHPLIRSGVALTVALAGGRGATASAGMKGSARGAGSGGCSFGRAPCRLPWARSWKRGSSAVAIIASRSALLEVTAA